MASGSQRVLWQDENLVAGSKSDLVRNGADVAQFAPVVVRIAPHIRVFFPRVSCVLCRCTRAAHQCDHSHCAVVPREPLRQCRSGSFFFVNPSVSLPGRPLARDTSRRGRGIATRSRIRLSAGTVLCHHCGWVARTSDGGLTPTSQRAFQRPADVPRSHGTRVDLT